MTTKDQDTDPSTPEAMRGLAPTDPTPSPIAASTHVSTDPGVGPPSRPPIAPTLPLNAPGMAAIPGAPAVGTTQRIQTPPMGIVVPASMRIKPRKDSVELLLDGMQGPQPERPKQMPATDGQSSASYHAEHGVRPARTSPDEEPKVVVERAPQAPTTRIDRAKVQAVIEAAEARQRALNATADVPHQIGPRVIVAIVAGLVVVLGLFVVAKLMMGDPTTATASASPAMAPAPPSATATATGSATGTATATATATATGPATATASAPASAPSAETASTDTAPSRPVATGWPPASAAKPAKAPRAAPGSTAGSSDIGEFKTTLH